MAYNGWTNYQTWMVNLWLSNDGGIDREYQRCRTAEHVKALVGAIVYSGDYAPEPTGFIADLVGTALSEVNWRELAEHIEHDDDEDEDDLEDQS